MQALGGPLVPPALDQNVEHDPILVDRPSEPVLLAGDPHLDLVEVPYVDGPCSQGDDIGLGDLIACAHMSGLLARSHMSAGQGGFRDARPKHWCDQARPLAPAGSLTSRVDRSHHLFVLLQGPASARHGCGSVAPRTRADLYAPAVVTGALVAA